MKSRGRGLAFLSRWTRGQSPGTRRPPESSLVAAYSANLADGILVVDPDKSPARLGKRAHVPRRHAQSPARR